MADIAKCEADVQAILASGKYGGHIRTFTSLLREYQFQPAALNTQLCARMMLHCLGAFDTNDCAMCMCLINEKVHDSAEVKAVAQLEDLLERGNYIAFWPAYAEVAPKLGGALPRFEDAVRSTMLRKLSHAFVSTDAAKAVAMLGVANKEALLKVEGVNATLDGAWLVFPANEFNRPTPPPPPRDLTSANVADLVRAA